MLDSLPRGLLALPQANDPHLPRILRKVRLLALRRLLADPAPALGATLTHARSVISASARRHSGAITAAVGHPDVLTPLLCREAGLLGAEEALRLAMPAFLLELPAGVVGEAILWDQALPRLPGLAGGERGLVIDPSGHRIRGADGRNVAREMAATLALPGGAHLTTLDPNPLSALEAHPEKRGNALDLAGHPPEEWCAKLSEALQLVADGLPGLAAELSLSLRRIVPVGFDAERHFSASYREAPGVAYLSLHPDPLTLASAIVHETQHTKLNLIRRLDPLLVNSPDERVVSPIRPDERPVMGVLLAVHAFAPVSALWLALRAANHPVAGDPSFERRFEDILLGNAEALATLNSVGRPTAIGQRVISQLEALHSAVRALSTGDRFRYRPDG
ncbi:MAG: HEXXH motif-containing protein [Myxococcota bacterium]|jgi:HEXXH motif-containing protein